MTSSYIQTKNNLVMNRIQNIPVRINRRKTSACIHCCLPLKELVLQFLLKWKWKCYLLSPVRLFGTPWTAAHQAPLSMIFPRQEYWSGLPFPSLGDLSDPGIEPRSLALQVDSLPSEPPGKPESTKQLYLLPLKLSQVHLFMWPLPKQTVRVTCT